MRSIFERFPDLNKLRIAAADYSLAQAAALAPARHVDGDRATRIRSQVETRAGTCERGVALWRVLLFSAVEDEEMKLRVRISRDRTIERMELMYRPELSTLPEPARKYMLVALEAITDIDSWARMRELHGLTFEEACVIWIQRHRPHAAADAAGCLTLRRATWDAMVHQMQLGLTKQPCPDGPPPRPPGSTAAACEASVPGS